MINTVVSTIEELQPLFPDAILVDGSIGGIGWSWDGVTLSPPPPEPTPIPTSVTMRQARIALLKQGLLDNVEPILASIPDELERRAAQIAWEYSASVERDHPLIAALALGLSLQESDVDALFELAASL